jgi:hypothetical protein
MVDVLEHEAVHEWGGGIATASRYIERNGTGNASYQRKSKETSKHIADLNRDIQHLLQQGHFPFYVPTIHLKLPLIAKGHP